jgi:hypothetical protein
MFGERIETVRKTLDLLLDHMKDSDALTLIAYSSAANTLCSACTDKDLLRQYIQQLVADGGTNMEAALVELLSLRRETLDAVFLLTDGHVNVGIQTSAGLLGILRSVLPSHVSVSTLGYGVDHNASLLQSIAVKTRGSYTFADAKELIPAVVGDIVGGLKTEIGRGCSVSIPEGGSCLEIGDSESMTYYVGSLTYQKPQWIMMNIPNDGECQTLTVSWKNLTTGEDVVEQVNIEATGTEEVENTVKEQWFRVRAARLFATVKETYGVTSGNVDQEPLKEFARELRNSFSGSTPLGIRILAQIDETLHMLASRPPPPPSLPSFPRSPLRRAVDVGSYEYADAGLLTRMTSNMTTFALQRGILSQNPGEEDPAHVFSSPMQRHVSGQMVSTFSQPPVEP